MKNEVANVAIVRIEQLAPFPFEAVLQELQKYSNARIVWAQEEPKNMGAYFYAKPRLETCLREMNDGRSEVVYAGRKASASPATGKYFTLSQPAASPFNR